LETSLQVSHDSDTTRIAMVRAFLAAGGEFISGELLSQKLGVTRTAIWKHINALESLGFSFESIHRRGYRMTGIPDIILEPLLEPFLSPGTKLGRTVSYLKEVDSTNIAAQKLVHQGANHGTVVCAGKQNGGKGRRGRIWFSPEGGLWMSIIMRQPFPLQRAAELTLLASVGIRRAIFQVSGIDVKIKWPNDLLLNGKKICGILAEIRADGENVHYAVIGFGINTNIARDLYPPELSPIATSLYAETGKQISNVELAGTILNELDPLFSDLATGKAGFRDVLEEWKDGCATLGKRIQVQTARELLCGEAVDVDGSGILYLKLDNGDVIPIHSGDILFD
jgi:BirA family transcriptional regulator, biotin operon repressor / biotin---[acetyl-CoA-carboxylase] ligase